MKKSWNRSAQTYTKSGPVNHYCLH